MKIFTRIVALLAISSCLHAQDFDNYQLLEPSGPIPSEFLIPSSTKYNKEIAMMEQGIQVKEQKARKEFYLESHFTVDDLLQSGMVIFNDPISAYINRVADELLRDDPALRSKIRIYLVSSPSVNAFATNDGIVFINMGLIAQLENEAQLAFILSHEFTHVDKSHTLELFLDSKGLGSNPSRRDMLRKASFDEAIIARHSYSKELETEADNEGLRRYLKSNYSVNAINSVFDVLLYSYLPFDDDPFDKTFFESEYLKFPPRMFLDSVKAITGADEDEDDTRSTHPNIAKRRTEVLSGLKGVSEGNRQRFVVSEQDFMKFREVCRFELAWLYCHGGAYEEAVYASFLLLKKHPQSVYLNKIILKSLYGLTKYRNANESTPYSNSYTDVEGESQQLYYLFDKLAGAQLNVLALHYGWATKLKYPQDKEINALVEDIFQEMVLYHYDKASDFIDATQRTEPEPTKEEASKEEDNQAKSKYDKIREKKSENLSAESLKGSDFEKYALSAYLNDTTFTKYFEIFQKEKERREKRTAYYKSSEGKRQMKKDKQRGARLGIDKVLVVNPAYYRIDARKGSKLLYIKSESGQEDFRGILMQNAKKTGIEATMLDVANLDSTQIEQFNDITLLRNWLSEQADATDFIMLGSQQEAINRLAGAYGTDYVLLSGVISLRMQNPKQLINIIAAVAFWPLFPLFLPAIIRPYHEMLYFSIVYDVRESRFQAINFDFFKRKDTKPMLKLLSYDTFNQIKRKPKK